MTTCPDESRLLALLDAQLPAAEEVVVRSHVDECAVCHGRLMAVEPAWMFTAVRPTTLREEAWDDVMRAVRVEVHANPRRSDLKGRVLGWLTLPSLRPAAVGVVAATLVGFSMSFVLPGSGARPLTRASHEIGADPLDFVYLSNPRAEVTHVLVTDDEDLPVALTMVVDDSLAGLF